MQIICDNCQYVINRDKYINGKLVEEYSNTYGTRCPQCGYLIKPLKKPMFIEEQENKKMALIASILNKIKKKIVGDD